MPSAPKESLADELLRYVRLTDDDARALERVRPLVDPHFRRIAQEFYERVREHEDAHAVFSGEEQIARLQTSMVGWLERLFGGTYDAEYFARTQRIGQVHVKVGLPQRYMPAAMALLRTSLCAILEGHVDARSAISRLLDVELAIMLESYRDHLVDRIERASRVDEEAVSRRLARAEKASREAIDDAPLMIVALDADAKIVLWNRESERITGHARDEMHGRSFVEVLVDEEGRRAAATMLSSLVPVDVELSILTRSGKERDVRWHLVRRADGESIRLLAFGTDVTETRAETLRHRQQERLAAVGTLAAGLAHEIRNPLNGALLHVSFLERALAKTSAGAEAIEAVDVVSDEIKRLARLVTDFLDFARPKPLKIATTSARVLCERAAHLVANAAAGGHVDMKLDLPATDVTFEADGQRLEQVLLNLLNNAIEALAPHGGHVTLRARREPHHVGIEVEDDGPGLPSGDAPVFDAFFSTKPTGTGLGLAIVHRIVSDHAGTIEVDSRPGRTRFRVKLPLSQQGTKS